MANSEFKIPFETGIQDRDDAEMLETFAAGRWADGPEGTEEALAERPALRDLFAQMTKDQLVDTALMLIDEAEELPIWGADKAGNGVERPDPAALRTMKQDALVAYMASAYQRAMVLLAMRLDYKSVVQLLWMAEQKEAALVGMIDEAAEESEAGEGRVDVWDKYGELICSGLIVPRRLCQFQNTRFYGLFVPDEVRAFDRGHNGGLLVNWLMLDVLDCYALAAANLYGIVTMEELPQIVRRYEAQIAKDGARYGEIAELDRMIQDMKQDGDLDAFRTLTDRRREISKALRGMSAKDLMGRVYTAAGRADDYGLIPVEHGGEGTIVIVSGEMIERAADDDELLESVHTLMDSREIKPRYFPASYNAFMGYAQDMVNEDVPAVKQLARLSAWFVRKHRDDIARAIRQDAEESGERIFEQRYESADEESVGRAADEIAAVIYRGIACMTINQLKRATALEMLEERYGIVMRDIAEANEYLALWREVNSNARMFGNNAHTPLEIRAKMPPQQGPTKLVFGPGVQGTDIPPSIQKAIQSGEFGERFTVDAAEVKRAGRKIGRNEPCPCGSGKKYKHCCGKNI